MNEPKSTSITRALLDQDSGRGADEILFLLLILDHPDYSHSWLVLRLGTSLPYVAAAAAIGLRIAEGSKTKVP